MCREDLHNFTPLGLSRAGPSAQEPLRGVLGQRPGAAGQCTRGGGDSDLLQVLRAGLPVRRAAALVGGHLGPRALGARLCAAASWARASCTWGHGDLLLKWEKRRNSRSRAGPWSSPPDHHRPGRVGDVLPVGVMVSPSCHVPRRRKPGRWDSRERVWVGSLFLKNEKDPKGDEGTEVCAPEGSVRPWGTP